MHAWIWKVIHELRDGPLEKLRGELGNFRAGGIVFVIKFLVGIIFKAIA